MHTKKVVRFFDKVEDVTREHLSQFPITYSIIGGIAVVLFWRGVWETADLLATRFESLSLFFYPPVQVLFSVAVLLLTGLMVSVFIGDRIILSGLRHEKKLEEKTKELVGEEVVTLAHIKEEIHRLRKEVQHMQKQDAEREII